MDASNGAPETFLDGRVSLYAGDCLAVLGGLDANSVDAVVTDPPYGLEFMGKGWDGADGFRRSLNKADADRDNVFGRASKRGPEYKAGSLFQRFIYAVALEAFRVLKPGGHLLAFSGTRTYHRMACAIEDAGFEIRDQIGWAYGSGFPKSRNLDGEWKGWGTALKPAWEPICLARKPLIGTVAENVQKHGTGALNIDGCRVGSEERTYDLKGGENLNQLARQGGNDAEDAAGLGAYGVGAKQVSVGKTTVIGRWPANIVHDGSDEVVAGFPQADSARASGNPNNPKHGSKDRFATSYDWNPERESHDYRDTGSAARFFYTAKADADDRLGSKHPTVKPLDLMQWLVRLVMPPKGLVLDPFAGTGTTGEAAFREGFRSILIEREPDYLNDIRSRMALALSGRDERRRAAAKNRGEPKDELPLFQAAI